VTPVDKPAVRPRRSTAKASGLWFDRRPIEDLKVALYQQQSTRLQPSCKTFLTSYASMLTVSRRNVTGLVGFLHVYVDVDFF